MIFTLSFIEFSQTSVELVELSRGNLDFDLKFIAFHRKSRKQGFQYFENQNYLKGIFLLVRH